jgi:hypothetical protein
MVGMLLMLLLLLTFDASSGGMSLAAVAEE